EVLWRHEESRARFQQYSDTVRRAVCHYQIQPAIAVDVARGHVGRVSASTEGHCRQKGPIADAEQYGDGAGARVILVGDSEIKLAVAVEVTHGHRHRKVASTDVERRLEGPVAVAQQHRDAARVTGRTPIGE